MLKSRERKHYGMSDGAGAVDVRIEERVNLSTSPKSTNATSDYDRRKTGQRACVAGKELAGGVAVIRLGEAS